MICAPSSRTIGWSSGGRGVWAGAVWAFGSTQDPKMATAIATEAAIAAVAMPDRLGGRALLARPAGVWGDAETAISAA